MKKLFSSLPALVPAHVIAGTLFLLTASVYTAAAQESIDYSAYKISSYYFGDSNTQSEEVLAGSLQASPMIIGNGQQDIIGSSFEQEKIIDPSAASNTMAVAAEFNATENLTVQGAFGITKTASANNPTHSSWEANLGVIYKFYNNLSYGVHFAYMDTGDMFQQYDMYNDEDRVILISNQLTLSF